MSLAYIIDYARKAVGALQVCYVSPEMSWQYEVGVL